MSIRIPIYEKPDSCIICTENSILNRFECGHWLHIECLKKQFKPECPLCRMPLNIQVNGTKPTAYIPHTVEFESEPEESGLWYFRVNCPRTVLGDVIERGYESDNDSDISNWRQQGYCCRSEHPDYDSQNPQGDEMDYPDEESDEFIPN